MLVFGFGGLSALKCALLSYQLSYARTAVHLAEVHGGLRVYEPNGDGGTERGNRWFPRTPSFSLGWGDLFSHLIKKKLTFAYSCLALLAMDCLELEL